MPETKMSESQRTRCRNIMVGHAESLICGHSDEIMNTLNEMFESSLEDKASLDIPIVLRVKRDVDAGYTFGGIIGKTVITDCVTESQSPWFFGTYGFVLKNSQELPFMPCKGKLSFFEVDYHAD